MQNILPILQYIPNWFPGAGFKGYAEQMKKNSEKTIYGTYKLAVEKIVRFRPVLAGH
jgi:hypothetical protein